MAYINRYNVLWYKQPSENPRIFYLTQSDRSQTSTPIVQMRKQKLKELVQNSSRLLLVEKRQEQKGFINPSHGNPIKPHYLLYRFISLLKFSGKRLPKI